MRSFSQSCSTTVQLVGLATRRGLRTRQAAVRVRVANGRDVGDGAYGVWVRELGAEVSALECPAALAASASRAASHLEPCERALSGTCLPTRGCRSRHPPRRQDGRAAEAGHVHPDLGDQAFGGALSHPGDRGEQLHLSTKRGDVPVDLLGEPAGHLVQVVSLARISPTMRAWSGPKRPSRARRSWGSFHNLPRANSGGTSGPLCPARGRPACPGLSGPRSGSPQRTA